MIREAFLKLSVSLLVVFATGCSDVVVTIDSPDEETVYTDVPDFSVSWEGGGSAADFTASLNGVDITDRFDVTETTATLTDPTLSGELRHDRNLFVAVQGQDLFGGLIPMSSRAEARFIVDLKGPRVQVDSTEETVGVNTFVNGFVSDPSGVDTLSFTDSTGASGGITIEEDNTFTLNLGYRDPNKIVFTATDNIGQVSTSTFYRSTAAAISNDAPVPNELTQTLDFRADIDALTVISAVAPDLIAELDIAAELVSPDPAVDIGLLLLDVEVFIDDAQMSIPIVDIASSQTNGFDLDLNIVIEDLDLDMRICVNPLFLPRLCQEAFVNTTSLIADAIVDLGASGVGELVMNDMLFDYQINGLEPGLNLFNLDALGIGLPDILQPITDALVNLIGNFLVDVLRPLLADIITDVLGSVPLTIAMEIQYAHEETPRLIDITAFFKDIVRDDDDLVMTMGLRNTLTLHDVTDPLGVRTFGFAPPTSTFTPNNGEADFTFALSASFLNHLLHDLYLAGILNVDIPVGNIDGKPAFARLVPNEPPHMSIEEFDLGMAELSIWNFAMVVEVQTDPVDPDLGFDTLFSATLDMDAPITIVATGGNALAIEISNQLSLEIVDLVTEGEAGEATVINGLLSAVSGPIVNALTAALQQIELPEILGMNILPVEVWADKTNGTFIIAGNLELAEELPVVASE